MSVSPAQLSRYVWISAASLFVVFAVAAGVVYFRHSRVSNDTRCQSIRDSFQNRGPLDELTHEDAVCAGVMN